MALPSDTTTQPGRSSNQNIRKTKYHTEVDTNHVANRPFDSDPHRNYKRQQDHRVITSHSHPDSAPRLNS